MRQDRNVEPGAAGWKRFYLLAAVGLALSVGLVLVDIGLSFAGGDLATGSSDATGWFAHFQSNWLLGLRNLGLFNVINTILMLPMYLVVYRLHLRQSPALAALALSLILIGAAIYDANNRALAMLALSQQYAAAGAGQKAVLEAAGAAILAQAEDFTPGSFTGLFVSNGASLLMTILMLRGQVFHRWVSIAGVVGNGLLLIFTLSVTFVPASFDAAMVLALVGGLCMLAWDIAVAVRLARLGQEHSPAAAVPAVG